MATDKGFVLYNMSADDGASSQFSGISGFSDNSSARLARNGRAPPPPHTATLRTNFTSAANPGMPVLSHDSPSMTDFRTADTPPSTGVTANPFEASSYMQTVAGGATSTLNMWATLGAMVLGVGVGLLLHHFDVSVTVSHWIRLTGDLYVRAVQCIVVPLVFVNVAVSVADIVHLGRGVRIGAYVIFMILLVTLVSVAEGIGMGYLTRALLDLANVMRPQTKEAIFGIQCSNGRYLQELADGLVTCSATQINKTSEFLVTDVANTFVRNSQTLAVGGSLTDHVIKMLSLLVPANITQAFMENAMLSIVAFAVPCGITLAKSFHGPIQLNPLLEFLREVNDSLLLMVHWVIRFTPIAVFSLLAGSFGENLDDVMAVPPLHVAVQLIGIYVGAVAVHMLVVIPILFVMFTQTNPYSFMRHLLPAYIYSTGCASSFATLPVSIRCIEMTRQISTSLMHFVMSIGGSLNMNGSGIYLPMMVFFLADVAGLREKLDAIKVLTLVMAAFMGSLTTSPIPGGTVVMLKTVWRMVFPNEDIPEIYTFLVAIDVIIDRFITMCNVNGDIMVTRMIESQVDRACANDVLRNNNSNHTAQTSHA
ncbi:hypothetical protein PINS_up009767 [Pythium insidiosum]|nr:hypothetical protein PINS_up009767 [Pythium insidiosum]